MAEEKGNGIALLQLSAICMNWYYREIGRVDFEHGIPLAKRQSVPHSYPEF